MKLERMSEPDYQTWLQDVLPRYSADKERANGLSAQAAQKMAEAEFARLLPQGLSTNGQLLYVLRNEKNQCVGSCWIADQRERAAGKAFIYDIIIHEEFRGQGLGRRAMKLIEDEIRGLGFKSLGLHVFGHNIAALRLYQSLDYETTDLVMVKPL